MVSQWYCPKLKILKVKEIKQTDLFTAYPKDNL